MENIPFIQTNATAATVFATFWVEKIKGATPDSDFLQLQYVQTVFLNFPLFLLGKPPVPLTLAPRVSCYPAKGIWWTIDQFGTSNNGTVSMDSWNAFRAVHANCEGVKAERKLREHNSNAESRLFFGINPRIYTKVGKEIEF